MFREFLNPIIARHWMRVSLAVVLIIVGLAPVGAPILSDSAWRRSAAEAESATTAANPFTYRWHVLAENTEVLRSDDGGLSWHAVATIPQPVSQLAAMRGDEQTVLARGATEIWSSRDGGLSWSQTARLPSRPLSMAIGSKSSGLLLVGTESVGLLASRDLGATWQPIDDAALAGGGAVPLAITALAVNDGDDSILYAATGIWLGTSRARLTPVGIYASLDGGRRWLEVERLPLSAAPVTGLSAAQSDPLVLSVKDEAGVIRPAQMKLTPELLALLDSEDAGLRTSAAKAIGLIGDTSALPTLLSHLGEPDMLAGDAIAWAIGRLGDRSAVPALTRALAAGDEASRAQAAYALGLLKATEAVPQLAQSLLIGEPMTARRAAEALAAIGTQEALNALAAALADGDLTSARHAAMIGLETAGPNAIPTLTAALSHERSAVRANAAEMLGWLKAAPATDELAKALTDPDPAVRGQVAWALGEVGTPEARSLLSEALAAETDAATQRAAASALAHVDELAGEGPGTGQTAWAALQETLTAIPASRWTLMAFALVLAAILLGSGRRQPHSRM